MGLAAGTASLLTGAIRAAADAIPFVSSGNGTCGQLADGNRCTTTAALWQRLQNVCALQPLSALPVGQAVQQIGGQGRCLSSATVSNASWATAHCIGGVFAGLEAADARSQWQDPLIICGSMAGAGLALWGFTALICMWSPCCCRRAATSPA